MVSTNRETVRNLCKSLITRLENRKAISLSPRLRDIVRDEVFQLVGPFILTEEDLRLQTLQKIGASQEAIEDANLAESAPYRTARSLVRKSFGDDELNGLYFQRSLKIIADMIGDYLMRSSHIEEVYETDDDLQHMMVDIIRQFNPSQLN